MSTLSNVKFLTVAEVALIMRVSTPANWRRSGLAVPSGYPSKPSTST